MKFGHEIQVAAESLSDHYKSNVLSYKALKKLVKAVASDLEQHGVPPDQLRALQPCIESELSPPAVECGKGSAPDKPAAPLKYVLGYQENASSSSGVDSLESYLVMSRNPASAGAAQGDCEIDSPIKIPLPSDALFFQQLLNALEGVSEFQNVCLNKHFHHQFDDLVAHMGDLTKIECKDYQIWRALIRAYLEFDMFMTVSRKLKSVQQIGDNLDRFERAVDSAFKQQNFSLDHLAFVPSPHHSQVLDLKPKSGHGAMGSVINHLRHILAKLASCGPSRTGFRDKRSLSVYSNFLMLNHELFELNQLTDLNETALRKIIKKHDKKTQLPSRSLWESLNTTNAISCARSTDFTRNLIAQLNGTLTTITPLVDLHACPICAELMYPAVRLPACGHSLCYTCGYRLAVEASIPDPAAPDLPPTIPRAHVRDMPPHIFLATYGSLLPVRPMRCPICRAVSHINRKNAVQALLEQEDVEQSTALQASFPEEAKQRKKEWAASRGKEHMDLFSLACSPLS